MNSKLAKLKDKKVLILGFGREGKSTLRFLRKYLPKKRLGIADRAELSELGPPQKLLKNDSLLNLHLGEKYLESLEKYQVIFKTPGIPAKLKEVKAARKAGIEFTSQTRLFFDLCKGKIVGVTGTKGKSTTTTLIHKVLQEAGLKSVLLGNIGKPALDYLAKDSPDTIFVFELSSHQLSDLGKSPHIAVFLNIFQEHLDYYENFNDYLEAKVNITKYQKEWDCFVFNASEKVIVQLAKKTKAKSLGFSSNKKKDLSCYLQDDYLVYLKGNGAEKVISKDEVPLKGKHNLNNVAAAIIVGKILDIDTGVISKAVKSFEPLEHRLEEIGTYNGITFVDDSLSTIPEATIAALDALERKVGTLILGGSDRGRDFKVLAKSILENKVGNLVLFPDTGERIWSEIKKVSSGSSLPKKIFAKNMRKAVKYCYKHTSKGKVCLLSTASPSFSLFRNYEEKARLFRKYVRLFGRDRK